MFLCKEEHLFEARKWRTVVWMEVRSQKPEIKSRNLEKSARRSPHQSAGNCRYLCGQKGAHIQARASLGNTTGNFQNVLRCPPVSPSPGYMDLNDPSPLDVEGSKRSVFKKRNVTKLIGALPRQYYKKKSKNKNHVFVFVSFFSFWFYSRPCSENKTSQLCSCELQLYSCELHCREATW